jgi:hypothetical protein
MLLTGGLGLLWAFYTLVESSSPDASASTGRMTTFLNFGPIALAISFALGVALLAVSGSWRARLRPGVAWTDVVGICGLIAIGLVLYLRTRVG